ncbi:MAG: 30S ribosomal protein S20 [Dissulfurispiraceae bacterium]|nr:30S ribosomal protein S20 [Dissulfurispiraceae bacterium]
MAGKAAPKKNLSALKRVRQTEKRSEHNQAGKTKIKTYTKKIEAAVKANDKAQVELSLKEATKVISSVASKGIIHKNTAARKISRLAKKANSVKA